MRKHNNPFARLTARKSDNPNINLKKEVTMQYIKLLPLVATLVVAFIANPAYAQTPSVGKHICPDGRRVDKSADCAAPAPAATSGDFFPVKTWEELSELMLYVGRYYYVTMQSDYVDGFVKPSVRQIAGAKASQFDNLLGGFQFVLKGTGDKVPEKTNKAVMAWLKASGCEKSGKKWSSGCITLYDNLKPQADQLLKDAPKNDFTANAKKLLDTAHEYAYVTVEGNTEPLPDSAGDAVILLHGAIARLTVQLPEAKRPYKGLGSSGGNGTGGLVGVDGCLLYKDGTRHCGKVTKADDKSIKVNDGTSDKEATAQDISDGKAAFVVGKPENFQYVIGKEACFLRDGESARCGKVNAITPISVTITNDKDPSKTTTVPWKKLQKGGDTVLSFGDREMMERNWGKGVNNKGLYARGEFLAGSVFAPDQTDLRLIMVGGGVGGTFPDFPITLEFTFGAMVSPIGGKATHYTSLLEGGDRWAMYFKPSVGLRPMINDWFGLSLMASGLILVDAGGEGGGGFMAELGPEFYLGSDHSWVLGANFMGSYIDSGKPWGENPTIDTRDPRAQGGGLFGGLSLRKQIDLGL